MKILIVLTAIAALFIGYNIPMKTYETKYSLIKTEFTQVSTIAKDLSVTDCLRLQRMFIDSTCRIQPSKEKRK